MSFQLVLSINCFVKVIHSICTSYGWCALEMHVLTMDHAKTKKVCRLAKNMSITLGYFVQHEVHNHLQHIIECLKKSMNDIGFVCHVIIPLAELTFFTIKCEKIKHWQKHGKCQNKKKDESDFIQQFRNFSSFFHDIMWKWLPCDRIHETKEILGNKILWFRQLTKNYFYPRIFEWKMNKYSCDHGWLSS